MPNTPLRGERLEYLVTGLAGSNYYVRMKESIGNWLGLKPQYPRYGTFQSTPKNSIKSSTGTQLGNAGATYTKLAGFRFVSYKFFLIPNTVIVEPAKNGSDHNHTMQTISIGFPRGAPGSHTSVHGVIEFAKNCKQAKLIRGIQTPSGTKHLWRGKIGTSSGSGGSGGSSSVGGLLGDLGNIGSAIANNNGPGTTAGFDQLSSDLAGLLF